MALSTTRTLLTQTGINTHQVLDVGGLSSSGITTFSNFKLEHLMFIVVVIMLELDLQLEQII